MTKEFVVESGVTALACNYNDQYIAAGTQSGQIFLLNNVTKQISAPLKAKTVQRHEVTSLKYSQQRKSRLASSCQSGAVAFWDCNANAMIQQFVEHSAPCTGIALSPINETLAGSCGLDKKVILYDVERNAVINKDIKTEEPLTAIEIFPDGKTVAVGTSKGKILIYDMRHLSCPIQTKQVHYSAVQNILCQPPKDKFPSSALRTTKSRSRLLMKENVPSGGGGSSIAPGSLHPTKDLSNNNNTNLLSPNIPANNVTFGNNTTSNTPEIRRDSFSSQVFSPLRDQDFPSPMARSQRSSSVGSNDQSGIFSPLREQSFNSPAMLKTPLGSLNSLSRTPLVSPLTIIREESPQKDVTKRKSFFSEDEDEEMGSGSPSPRISANQFQTLAMLKESREENDNNSVAARQNLVQETLPTATSSLFSKSNYAAISSTPFQPNLNRKNPETSILTKEAAEKESITEIKAVMTAFPQALLESKAMEIAEDAIDSQTPSSKSQGQDLPQKQNLTDFQQDFLRGCVEEAMDDFCSDMRKQLWHIQYDSIRAFQRQKEEIKHMLRQHVLNENLVLENERLRMENAELKKYH